IQFGAKAQRQTHQRALKIVSIVITDVADDADLFAKRPQHASEAWLDEESYLGSARGEQRQIARELKDISQALLGDNQDAALRDILSLPRRSMELRALTGKRFRFPAPFIVDPAFPVAANEQSGDTAVGKSVSIVGLERDGLIVT